MSAEAQRGLQRLLPKISLAVVEFITVTLPANPIVVSKPLRSELEGLRSARGGDYRIPIRMHETESLVEVVRIVRRSVGYRPGRLCGRC